MALERPLLLELAKRIVYLLVALVLVLTFIFFSFFVVPGDPTATLAPAYGDPFFRAVVIEDLKLNESLPAQYVNFMVKMLTGDFFVSSGAYRGMDIEDFIYEPAGGTLVEFVIVVVVSMLLGYSFGKMLAQRPRSIPKRLVELLVIIIMVLPPVLLAQGLFIEVWSTDLIPVESMATVGRVVTVMVCIPTAVCSYALIVRSTILGRISPVLDRRAPGFIPKQMGMTETIPHLLPLTHAWMAWIVACVLLAELPSAARGLGWHTWNAILMLDFPLLMVCIYLFSLMVLISNFAMGLVFLFAAHRPSSSSVSPAAIPSVEVPIAAPSQMPSLVPDRSVPGLGRFWTEYRSSVSGMIALFALLAVMVVAIAAPILATVQDPNEAGSLEPNAGPMEWRNPLPPTLDPSPYTGFTHPLGTDVIGRDVYSMMLYGAREFLLASFGIVTISLLVGVLMWTVAEGIAKRSLVTARVGAAISTMIVDAIIAMPLMLLCVVRLVIFREDSFMVTFLLFGVLAFAWAVMTKKFITQLSTTQSSPSNMQYQGETPSRTPFSSTLSQGFVNTLHVTKFLVVIGLFSMVALEFMGLGDYQVMSWAKMLGLAFDMSAMLTGEWWTYLPPAIAIVLVTTSLYILIDSLESALRRTTTPTAQAASALISPSSSSPQAP